MASGIYDDFKEDLMDGSVDLSNGGDTLKVALLDSSHTFTAGDANWAAVSANEITGTGYSAGGVTMSTQSVAVATNTATFDLGDAIWTTATFTAAHAVVYSVTNSSSLIASFDFGGDQSVSAGTFTIQWHGNGVITLT